MDRTQDSIRTHNILAELKGQVLLVSFPVESTSFCRKVVLLP